MMNQLPKTETRCTEIFSDTLRGYAGIQEVEYDYTNGNLKAVFDPHKISSERALEVVQHAGREASMRVAQCAAKRERGEEACAQCVGELAEQLAKQYESAATLPTATFRKNTLEVKLETSNLLSSEDNKVEASFLNQNEAAKKPVAIPIERIEIAFTVINAITALTAFIGAGLAWHPSLIFGLYFVSYTTGGWFGLMASIKALKEKTLNVDLLMILAALGAAAIGQPAEGAMLLFLFSLSNTLQTYAMDRSRKAIEKLLDLRPAQATVRRGSRLVTLPIEQLTLGDIVLVRPGERFPIDGEVLSGISDVDQATITGESMPVHKQENDLVFAGTVNGTGSLEIRVTRLAKDTTLARIVKMVEEAQSTKANTQQMLDTFEQRYAIFVLAAAVLLIFVPWLILGHSFQPTFYRAMTWLVVASPCALVISTPASILSAIANGARNGVLFKGGVHLEKTATLKVLAFDKTGTLTSGKPALSGLFSFSETKEEDILRLVAALESRSEHPLARAIVQAAHSRDLNLPSSMEFRAIPGQGVEGVVESRHLLIGNERMYQERSIRIPVNIMNKASEMHDEGQTAMFVYDMRSQTFLGLLGVADTLREDAVEMIKALKAIGIEHIVMLTGDNAKVASKIAARAGVDEFHADLLPQDKVTVLKSLQRKYGPVAMVGDGVNDAPSLATADIGIAMGGAGTDVAIETADVVLMSDDLRKIPFSIGLARQARKVVWQNLTFAMCVIVLLVAGAFGAELALPLGVVGHEGSTGLVVLNGLRLLGYK
ncbi:MAG: cadmium-translocating P-type ATPase [Anaerolineales bacterium]|uniref:heavy metal translocating P-type ATPase n=1 Tax=Candidatus Villigracilis vicinus TaxID=3140679 RepID=UPI003135FAC8|nr:cadmium-translocating P-type ATPase [Anaerolineales bacterium]